MYRSAEYGSPIGKLLIVTGDEALVGLWMEGQKHFGGKLPKAASDDGSPLLIQTRQWLDQYFRGEQPNPSSLPLAPHGTAFQQLVWQALSAIPYGQTCTYGDIAKAVGNPRACQAVGSAVGRNPISIIIPCHRVIGADGQLTGYAGGLNRKQWLLRHETQCRPSP